MERVSGTTNPNEPKSPTPDDLFSTETTGLSEAASPQLVRLHNGDRFDLRIEPVRKRLDAELRMLGYNGSIPSSDPMMHSIGRRTHSAPNSVLASSRSALPLHEHVVGSVHHHLGDLRK